MGSSDICFILNNEEVEEEELLGTFASPSPATSSHYCQKNHQEERRSSASQWDENMGMGGCCWKGDHIISRKTSKPAVLFNLPKTQSTERPLKEVQG